MRPNEYNGADLFAEVFDLMRRRLPDLAPGDPYRPAITEFLAFLRERCGRPAAALVSDEAVS